MSGAWDRLIEMVEEGEALTLPWMAAMNVAQSIYADSAYRGSLDNAKALHDDLLPGAHWHLDEDEDRGYVAGVFFGNWHEGVAKNPARAWLLAVLRAYAAQQEPTP